MPTQQQSKNIFFTNQLNFLETNTKNLLLIK